MSRQEAVAIIGMAGRFPGASDIDQFWTNLSDGVESIRRPTDDELERAGVAPDVREHRDFVRAGTIVDDIDRFDADFFDIPPREAAILDPQQRLFLECAWHALEDAGCDPFSATCPVGVYAAAGSHDYAIFHLYANPAVMRSAGQLQIMLGNDPDYMATRVSYKLGLRGPSVTVQTACSGSLVAVHLACESLLNAECDLALAGGASIRLPQNAGYMYAEGGILSPDGHCRAFDAAAAGTVFGNGVGVVVLKRLSDAEADGDHIRALILGSAVNNDGAAKVGYTAPSVGGQAEVIALAHAAAGVSPDTIGYVEAHGTGTALGDPIEVDALTRAFRVGTMRQGYCGLGSVKTNVGHLEAAAGVTGLIKTVLSFEHETLPPSLHFTRANPRMALATSPFYVTAAREPWRRGATVRRAGVSSFGIGGTNAHVVLEEAPVPAGRTAAPGPHLLVLSAKTAAARDTLTVQLAAHLEAHPDLDLGDVAYTLQVGRRAQRYRRIVIAETTAAAAAALRTGEWSDGEADPTGAPSASTTAPCTAAQLEVIGRQWLAGTPIDWASLHGDAPRRVPLPTYPFARVRHWIDPPPAQRESLAALMGAGGPHASSTDGGVVRRIAAIWQDVLGVPAVESTDRFIELGGDSALAVLAVSKAREEGIRVAVEDVLGGRTVADLAAQVVVEWNSS